MGTLAKLISTQNFIFQGSEDCKCYILHNIRRARENHLKVAVWFSWWEGHWNWKEITRVSSDAKFHATTFVWCVDDWQLPLKYGMLVIIVVFPINFSYNWSTDTMPAINPQWQRLEIRVSSSPMGRHWLIPRQKCHSLNTWFCCHCYNNVQNCQLYSAQIHHFKTFFWSKHSVAIQKDDILLKYHPFKWKPEGAARASCS